MMININISSDLWNITMLVVEILGVKVISAIVENPCWKRLASLK